MPMNVLVSAAWVCAAAQAPPPASEGGALVRIYDVGRTLTRLYPLLPDQAPNVCKVVPAIDLSGERGDFAPMKDQFLTEVTAVLTLDKPGEYTFRVTSDDGSRVILDSRPIIDFDGLQGGTSATGTVGLMPGEHTLRVVHFDNSGGELLKLEWRKPGVEGEAFESIPTSVLSVPPTEPRFTAPGYKRVDFALKRGRPGDQSPLESVHPGYDLLSIRPPAGLKCRVTGLAYLGDGRLMISLWDDLYGVLAATGTESDSWQNVRNRTFAYGLQEPMGLAFAKGQLYVAQKGELTRLVDNKGDFNAVNEYWTVCSHWPYSGNFGEYTSGLIAKDGALFTTLSMPLELTGRTLQPQQKGRGTVIRIDPDKGEYETVASGLRGPCGLGLGADGELFATDVQGDWVPSGKLVHVKQGRFFGARTTPAGLFEDQPVTPPAAWLPHAEVAVTPTQPTVIPAGPYQGHMLVGDLTLATVHRVVLEKVGGEYQGCVFAFAGGFESGVARLEWAPDGSLLVGGFSAPGWGREGRQPYGLQKLRLNGKTAFEMFAVRAKSNGMEIEFTQPLAPGAGWDTGFYEASQWRYEPKADFGGGKVDEETLEIKSASVSDDRKHVFLELPGIKAGRVVYVRLLGGWASESGVEPWGTEAWYTMNTVPKDAPGKPLTNAYASAPNTLTEAEKKAGFKLLFDGKSTAGWRGFKKPDMPAGWTIEDGCLTRTGQGGDIVTADEFDNFELTLEWKIAKGGNSGIFYRVGEGDGLDAVWSTGPEMQVLDNDFHNDGQNPLTSAGSNYALYPAPRDLTLPTGRFNQVRIVAQGNKVEHWLNGVKVCAYEVNSEEWNKKVAESKFKALPRYGREPKGHVALQDHGDKVSYRNIKIRPLPAGGA
ncbi:MAG: DUF1080 domain-containing protein [Phycisphaerales bacterium]|nr:DUF1080 domain-containing protein [Phycisphaerales bacterium]